MNQISARARARMGFISVVSVIATIFLALFAAATLFLLFSVKYHSAAYNGGRLLVLSLPAFAAVTAIVTGTAAKSGQRWATWLGSIMFGVLSLPLIFLPTYFVIESVH